MFWQLLFAHFIADYPLQTDWIVKRKNTLSGLSLHVTIHLLVMLLVVGTAWWPYLILLTLIHFIIDIGKNKFSKLYPDKILFGYFIDQACHIGSIFFITMLISPFSGVFMIDQPWLIYGIGYLCVSYVWLVSERVIYYQDKDYQETIKHQSCSRLISRLGLLTTLLFTPTNLFFLVGLVSFCDVPYLTGRYRRRVWLIDVTAGLLMWCLIHLIMTIT